MSVTLDGSTPNERTDSNPSAGDTATAGSGPQEPSRVDRYVVLEPLGRGGMGAVYLAYDPSLDRRVALKLLRSDRQSEVGEARLLREARAMAKLAHPNVVTVFDVGTFGGHVYVTMELVSGATLAERVAKPRDWAATLALYLGAAEGLAAAHEIGLVHRDFKPDNVLLGEDRVPRVTDFGLVVRAGEGAAELDVVSRPSSDAASVETQGSLTMAGAVVGTPAFMAPEQHLGVAVDARADQFAFCVALYEALYGEHPFGGKTREELAVRVLSEPAKPQPDGPVPGWLQKIVVRGLQREPDERWPSVRALIDAIEAVRRRRRRLITGAGMLGLAGAFAGVALSRPAAVDAISEDPCATVDVELRGAWTAEVRGGVLDRLARAAPAFGASTGPAVAAAMDAHAAAWGEAARSLCRHDRDATWTESLTDRGVACLERDRLEFEALVSLLESLDTSDADRDVVRRAPSAVASLADVGDCLDSAHLLAEVEPPRDAATRERVRAIEARMAAARAEDRAGRFENAHAMAEALFDETRDLEWPATRHEVELLVGHARFRSGKYELALEAQRAAYFGASGDGPVDVAADASIEMVAILGDRLKRFDEMEEWALHAEASVRRAGNDPGTRAALDDAHGIGLWRAGRLDDALAAERRAVANFEEAMGPDHPHVAGALSNLSSVLSDKSEYEAALESLLRATTIYERSHGADHPILAGSLANLGILHIRLGRLEEARKPLERSLELVKIGYGAEHDNVSTIETNLANLAFREGRMSDAAEIYARVLRGMERRHGPESAQAGSALFNLSLAQDNLGRDDEALAGYRRALQITETTLGADHPATTNLHESLGWAAVGRGDLDAAEASFQRAIAITEAAAGDDQVPTAGYIEGLGRIALERRKWREAEARYRQALAIRDKRLGEDDARHAVGFAGLSAVAAARGDVDEAHTLKVRALERASMQSDPLQWGWIAVDVARGWSQNAALRGEARTLLTGALQRFDAAGERGQEDAEDARAMLESIPG